VIYDSVVLVHYHYDIIHIVKDAPLRQRDHLEELVFAQAEEKQPTHDDQSVGNQVQIVGAESGQVNEVANSRDEKADKVGPVLGA